MSKTSKKKTAGTNEDSQVDQQMPEKKHRGKYESSLEEEKGKYEEKSASQSVNILFTPLDKAALLNAISGHHKANAEKLLEEKSIDLDAQNSNGNTALHLAINQGSDFFNITSGLITAGAALNLANNQGMTPLMLAIHHKSLATVALLLENNATIHDPAALKEFLYACDQRDIDVCTSLKILCKQEENRQAIHAPLLGLKQYQAIRDYTEKLTRLHELVTIGISAMYGAIDEHLKMLPTAIIAKINKQQISLHDFLTSFRPEDIDALYSKDRLFNSALLLKRAINRLEEESSWMENPEKSVALMHVTAIRTATKEYLAAHSTVQDTDETITKKTTTQNALLKTLNTAYNDPKMSAHKRQWYECVLMIITCVLALPAILIMAPIAGLLYAASSPKQKENSYFTPFSSLYEAKLKRIKGSVKDIEDSTKKYSKK